ncbi:hypothetical protein [Flavobacterium sp.]|uniref:hypothetical protein n=1 Tax=Flavobacterium sp. TaxID=239 RepID=UPI002FDB194E
MENQNKDNNKIAGYIFVGFMFVGIGIGMAFHKAGIGTMVGMGVGFIASAIYRAEKNK